MRSRRSYSHTVSNIPLLTATIPRHLEKVASEFPDREAVVSVPQGKRLTYEGLLGSVNTAARGLLGLGFKKGERIGIWSTNNLEWLILQMATAKIGAILVNINPAYRQRELAYALSKSEVQGLFLIREFRSSDYLSMLVELVPEVKEASPGEFASSAFPSLRRTFIFDPQDSCATPRSYSGLNIWGDLLEAAARIKEDHLEAITSTLHCHEPINIQYTSGTTGFPKAVVLSHYNILNDAYFSGLAMHFSEQDRLCVPVPFYHCFGMVLCNLLSLSFGACLIIACEHFDAGKVIRIIETEKCTALHGVPTMFIAELEHPDFPKTDFSTLRTGIMAGAPCPPKLVKRVMEEMHCPGLLIGYGETEASPLTHLTVPGDAVENRVETVGKSLPHQEAKIIDIATGETVTIGKTGEICTRGYNVMRSYYGDPGGTAAAIDKDGWLHTGDLGVMDGDGYLRVTGRLKEMIIRGGENIYPREIEEFLYTHPKVAEVAVFGVPDAYYGEEVMAWIKLHKGQTSTEKEMQAFCQAGMAYFKVPRYVWFVDELPMTITGKFQKFRMREIAIEKLGIAAK